MRHAPVLFAVLVAAALFLGLDTVGWLDVREARDAVVAREMVARREVLTPLLAGSPHLEKPSPAYALGALAAAAGEGAPLASRLLRALVAVVLLLVAASIASEHFGARSGWLTAGVLGSCLALPLAARTDAAQLIATLLAWIACGAFADASLSRRPGIGARRVVGWGALAAAMLVGGPLPALWPLGGVALYAALVRRRGLFAALGPAAGLVLVLGIALPWYGAMAERHGAAFLGAAPFFPYAVEPRGPWYSAPLLALSFLAVGFFPWSALLAPAMSHAGLGWRRTRVAGPGAGETAEALAAARDQALRERERQGEHAAHFFIAALLAAFLPVLLYPMPPIPACLPAMPAAALLVGRYLDRLFDDDERARRPFDRAMPMVGLAATTASLLFVAVSTRIRDAAPELRLVAVVLLVGGWLPFLAAFMGRRRLAALLVAVPVAVGMPVAAFRLMPAVEDVLSARAVAAAMDAVAPPRATLALLSAPPPSLRAYAGRNLARVANAAEARGWRAADGYTYVAVRPLGERELARTAGGPIEIVTRTGSLVLARLGPGEPPAAP
jgi:4-amino-4-deoxy-L-arabinose transferase-like glycosyltransferase